MSNPAGHFDCLFTPNIPELFHRLNLTLAISTYQAGKMIFISAVDDERLIQLPRNFRHAMAVGYDGRKLAVAARNEVVVLSGSPDLAEAYPEKPGAYDTLFVPRAVYYTGQIDIHGLEFGGEKLWAVNTLFSCICTIDENYSFTPVWMPPFVDGLASEDRCHLNGMAVDDQGTPLYATTFSTGNEMQGWRKCLPNEGTLIDVRSNDIILNNLPMPHSPRLHNGKLYLLLSATGELVEVDTVHGTYTKLKTFDGFVRGLTGYGDYLFVGVSKLRRNSSAFKDLQIAGKSTRCGVFILHLPTLGIVGYLEYKNGVDEIFDLQVLPDIKRPGILNPENDVHSLSLITPQSSFWAKKREE